MLDRLVAFKWNNKSFIIKGTSKQVLQDHVIQYPLHFNKDWEWKQTKDMLQSHTVSTYSAAFLFIFPAFLHFCLKRNSALGVIPDSTWKMSIRPVVAKQSDWAPHSP